MRIGHGYDVHKLVEERLLILGGVTIPYEKGLLGHSDADVLTHAVMDALLGAAALGDIGGHFPDTDPKYKGADSKLLLAAGSELIREAGYEIGNADLTIIAQAPKLKPFIPAMRECIADILGCNVSKISVKATMVVHNCKRIIYKLRCWLNRCIFCLCVYIVHRFQLRIKRH